MVYRPETPKMGITISIKPYRKSRGMKGCGRGGSTGKKAEITQEGKEAVILLGSTFKDVCRQVRAQFRIPSGITINPDVTSL
jgi:hypothetical protein